MLVASRTTAYSHQHPQSVTPLLCASNTIAVFNNKPQTTTTTTHPRETLTETEIRWKQRDCHMSTQDAIILILTRPCKQTPCVLHSLLIPQCIYPCLTLQSFLLIHNQVFAENIIWSITDSHPIPFHRWHAWITWYPLLLNNSLVCFSNSLYFCNSATSGKQFSITKRFVDLAVPLLVTLSPELVTRIEAAKTPDAFSSHALTVVASFLRTTRHKLVISSQSLASLSLSSSLVQPPVRQSSSLLLCFIAKHFQNVADYI